MAGASRFTNPPRRAGGRARRASTETRSRAGIFCTAIAVALLAPACASHAPPPRAPAPGHAAPPVGERAPQPTQKMDPSSAVGLWHSSFGPVKIQRDNARGARSLMGVWTYDRDGKQVIGFFEGDLDGNVLSFAWNEPHKPTDLDGRGYVVFRPRQRRFEGRWWTNDGDRKGDWRGWQEGAGPTPKPQAAPKPAPAPTSAAAGAGDAASPATAQPRTGSAPRSAPF